MMDIYSELIHELKKQKKVTEKWLSQLKKDLAVKYKVKELPTNFEILLHCSAKELSALRKKLLTKPTRTGSGVAPVAIMTKPYPCPHGKCIYCPGGVKSYFGSVPQSYTGKEPATMRGRRNFYDSYLQIFNRLEQYVTLGHNCEKVELIIMGGTFMALPPKYREEFVYYSFKAMNDFSGLFYRNGEFQFKRFKDFFEMPGEFKDKQRVKLIHQKILKEKAKKKRTLIQEQKRNETAMIRCVALCIETRPDYGGLKEGKEMLRLGCTRVELGVQSVYNKVLNFVDRGHGLEETKKSFAILRDLGFKISAHYMPGLPLTSYSKDLAGMKQLFTDEGLRPDMLKLYPCQVAPGTRLYRLYKEKKFKPLDLETAAKLIAEFKPFVPEYCRIQRIQRDVPSKYFVEGVGITNLRQYIWEKYNPLCRCIRCREPKEEVKIREVEIKVIEYTASGGKEFFIAAEDKTKKTIFGFCRLRFPARGLIPEIDGRTAIVRELHVYGTATGLGGEGNHKRGVQHRGLGKRLLKTAEDLAKKAGKKKLAVISGVGVREYYKKLGYKREGSYMSKLL